MRSRKTRASASKEPRTGRPCRPALEQIEERTLPGDAAAWAMLAPASLFAPAFEQGADPETPRPRTVTTTLDTRDAPEFLPSRAAWAEVTSALAPPPAVPANGIRWADAPSEDPLF